MATVELTKENFEDVINSKEIVLIDFWAEWCGPCKMFGPIFEKASEKHADIAFAKCDTESQKEVAGEFGVQAIPTLAAFREKVLVFLQSGALPPKALDELIDKVKALDMEDVRAEIAKHEAEHECKGCGHDHSHDDE